MPEPDSKNPQPTDAYGVLLVGMQSVRNQLLSSNNECVGGTVEFSENTIANVSIDSLLDSGIYPADTKIPLKATFNNPVDSQNFYLDVTRSVGFPESILTFRLLIRRK